MSQSSFQGFVTPNPIKGGTNTGNATATAADIALGKTAYAVGVKVTGTSLRPATGTGTTDGSGVLTVTGLTFQPKFITVIQRLAVNNASVVVFSNGTLTLSTENVSASGSGAAWLLGSVSTNASGFVVSAGAGLNTTTQYDWIAIG